MSYGESTLALVSGALDAGVDHLVLLVRHSAREFEAGRHDLENPLTDEGRALARTLGERLPRPLMLRAYASPAERCVETAELILQGHERAGGDITRTRPLEALGVFYVLDQMKMFRAMQSIEGQQSFLERWFAGEVARDIMMPADLTARLIAGVAAEKLAQPLRTPQLDVLVTHDMTLYTLRDRLLGQSAAAHGEIEFLDGLILYRRDDELRLQSHHGAAQSIEL